MSACAQQTMGRVFVARVFMPLLGMALGTIIALSFWPRISNHLWPATDYYELIDVMVETADDINDYIVYATRKINKPFDGRYVTTIRRLGAARPICSGGQSLPYRPTAADEDGNRTATIAQFGLGEWTEGAKPPCVQGILDNVAENGAGVFEMETCIYINEGVVIDTKRVCAISVFPYPRAE